MTISVKILFLEISAKMESICANSSQTGFVVIDHYSSKSGEWRQVQFDTTQYQEAFAEVQKIEKDMPFIAAEVKKKENYEVWNEIKSLQIKNGRVGGFTNE